MKISLESAMEKYPEMDVLHIHSIIGAQGYDLLPDGSGWEKKETPAQTLGRMGGAAKTEAKAKASAENGKLGGRPRKKHD